MALKGGILLLILPAGQVQRELARARHHEGMVILPNIFGSGPSGWLILDCDIPSVIGCKHFVGVGTFKFPLWVLALAIVAISMVAQRVRTQESELLLPSYEWRGLYLSI